MDGHEQRKIEHALAVLRQCWQSPTTPGQGPALKLALRVLMPYAGKDSLTAYWSVCDNPNPVQRMHNLRRIYEVLEPGVLRHVGG